MRVLIISHAYTASYNRRGKLARLAKLPDVELGIIVPANWRDKQLGISRRYEKIPEDNLYQIWALPTFLTGYDLWYSYLTLSLHKIVRKFNPDIIHIEQESFSQSLFQICAMNKLFWRKKLVSFFWENIDRKLNPLQKFFRWFNLRNINFAICGNSDAKKLIRKYGFAKASKIFPQFGVDEQKFYPKDVEKLREMLKLRGFIIGFVGRLVPEKGINTLLQTISQLIGDFTLLILTSMKKPAIKIPELTGFTHPMSFRSEVRRSPPLADEGGRSDRILKRCYRSLRSLQHDNNRIIPKPDKRVRIIDSMSHEEFPDYMNLFDVLVLPSETTKTWKEQFGRVMIEAMACGVPVIGSSSGAIPEVIGNTGLIFQEKNANDLTEKIKLLMENEKFREELGKKSLQRVKKCYTHDKITQQTHEVYQNISCP